MSVDLRLGEHPKESMARTFRDTIEQAKVLTMNYITHVHTKYLLEDKIHKTEYWNKDTCVILFKDGTYLKLRKNAGKLTHEIGTYELVKRKP